MDGAPLFECDSTEFGFDHGNRNLAAFFRECHSRGVDLAIVNGRLSSQSTRRYKWIRFFLKRVLQYLTLAVMQTETDAARIIELGMDPARVAVSGNMKFDVGLSGDSRALVDEFRDRFGISATKPLMIAASTHAPEESNPRCVAASEKSQPTAATGSRHPERFDEVASLLDRSGLKWSRRSSLPHANDKLCDAILLDTIGELSSVYALGTIVFVGGSISATGNNILEPAAVGAAIITGPHTHNFAAITKAFLKAGAIVNLTSGNNRESARALAAAIDYLLSNEARRFELQRKAKELVAQNRGQRSAQFITSNHYLRPSARSSH